MTPLPETLLWLCNIPSLIGEEAALCSAVADRLARVPLAAPIRRYGNSIVVPLTRGTGGPHVALVGPEHGAGGVLQRLDQAPVRVRLAQREDQRRQRRRGIAHARACSSRST